MVALSKIQAQIAKLQAQADAVLKTRSNAVAKIKKMMSDHGLTTADLDSTKVTAKAKVGAKKTSKKAAAAKKAPMPPKYINAKTGQTWSGHARPPAWIKDAKNRDKFLIDAPEKATAASKKTQLVKVAAPLAAED